MKSERVDAIYIKVQSLNLKIIYNTSCFVLLLILIILPMLFLCKFGQNPPIGSGDRVQTRLISTVFIVR